jgi:hypothetical protein
MKEAIRSASERRNLLIERQLEEQRIGRLEDREERRLDRQLAAANNPADVEVRRMARKTLEAKDNTFLDVDSLVTIIELFGSDTEASRTYLDFRSETLRRHWLRRQLEKAGRKISDFVLPSHSSTSNTMVAD